MEPARVAFEEIVLGAEFANARIPVLQNTDPTPETDGERIRERLVDADHIPGPLDRDHVRACGRRSDHRSIEAGPGSVLSGLAKRVDNITARRG